MSAIWGIARFDGLHPDTLDLDRMGLPFAHRAPDGRRSRFFGTVGLGRGLMRVTREDAFDAQPVRDDSDADLAITIAAPAFTRFPL